MGETLKGCRILIVEDDPTQVKFLQEYLEDEGAVIFSAANGKLGLDAVSEHKPDMVIADINMPIMDGFRFLDEMKESVYTKDIPVVMLTAGGDDGRRAIAMEKGASHFLTKPIQWNQLIILVDEIPAFVAFVNNHNSQGA